MNYLAIVERCALAVRATSAAISEFGRILLSEISFPIQPHDGDDDDDWSINYQ